VNRVTFWAANEQLSDAPVLVPRQAAETFLAGLVVNQVDDERPHDRTSLLIKGGDRGSMFQDVIAEARNGFVWRVELFRRLQKVRTNGESVTVQARAPWPPQFD
jgi:hypothetical protein